MLHDHRAKQLILVFSLAMAMVGATSACLDETEMAAEQSGSLNPTNTCPLPRVCIIQQESAEQGCTETYAPHGTVCDDGDPNTAGDACNGQGLCQGSSPTCPAPSKCISTYQNVGSKCMPVFAGPDAVCDDGNPSTMNDRCDGNGGCSGDSIQCPATTDCTPSYTLIGGICVPKHLPLGAPCSDGLEHTAADSCNGAGVCLGQPTECPEPEGCIIAYGIEAGQCIPHNKPKGATCSDGDPSTMDDVCNAQGKCQGTPCGSTPVLFANGANEQTGHATLSGPGESKFVVLESLAGRVAWVKATLSMACDEVSIELSTPSSHPNMCFNHALDDPCKPVATSDGHLSYNCMSPIHWFLDGEKLMLPNPYDCGASLRPCAIIDGAGKELYADGAVGLGTCEAQCAAFPEHINRTCEWAETNIKP